MRIGNFVFLLPYSLLDVVVIQRRPASFGNRLLLGSRETSLSLSLSLTNTTHTNTSAALSCSQCSGYIRLVGRRPCGNTERLMILHLSCGGVTTRPRSHPPAPASTFSLVPVSFNACKIAMNKPCRMNL